MGGGGGGSRGEDDRVSEWEVGLPISDDLAPLSQRLISPELASAFNISLEPYRTTDDVHRASQTTLSTIRGNPQSESDNGFVEEANVADDVSKTQKRQRLVWTSQLHKRFVDVVSHLGIDNAVPKTIMQMMNVEGLTRENVASHLQKYRLYVKRMQGGSDEGTSSSDSLSASTPNPQSLMMQVPVMSGHGAYPWIHQHHGSFGSYHHLMGSNNK